VEVPGVPQNIEITVFEIALLPKGATDSHFLALKGDLNLKRLKTPVSLVTTSFAWTSLFS